MTQVARVPASSDVTRERTAQIAIRAVLGLTLGASLGFIGFGDYAELQRMFTLADFRLYLTFGGAVLVTAVGLRLFVHHPLPRPPIRAAVPMGAALFGVGWALGGACPGIALVQLGEGTVTALLTFSGMLVGFRVVDAMRAKEPPRPVGVCGP